MFGVYVCLDMYNCLLVKLQYYRADDVGGISPEQQRQIDEICPPTVFYHGRFDQLAQCSDICREPDSFCENNCPGDVEIYPVIIILH